jgi:hypothetical protein
MENNDSEYRVRFSTSLMALAHNLNLIFYTDNLNYIPEGSGQPGEKPGFFYH